MQLAQQLTESGHIPVMRQAVLEALAIQPDGIYVDCTYGRGGHATAILERLGEQGRLLALDKDPEACADARDRFADDPRFAIEQGSFARLRAMLEAEALLGRIGGILFDLGVSSPQLEDPGRGFSFQHAGPLDMRMDPQAGESVADWLARAERRQIAEVLWRYGEERLSRRIADAIVRRREQAPIETTVELAAVIKEAVPAAVAAGSRIHPATRSFQALRIFINNELADLSAALPQAHAALAPGGRLTVISFHSLEDRIVKRFMRSLARPDIDDLPPMAPRPGPALRLIGGARRPSQSEIDGNPRARSAVLRVAERM